MITGRRLFAGETVSDTLAGVLKTEVDWSHLPSNTPAAVRRLLRHCLARDRKLRLQDIGDARVELSEIDGERDSLATAAISPSRPTMAAVGCDVCRRRGRDPGGRGGMVEPKRTCEP